MDFDRGTIERNMIDLNVNDVMFLQCGENMIQDTFLGPSISAGVNRMPIAKLFRQSAPFAAVFCNIKNGIEHL
jgi:hypothetical protein